MLTHQPESLRDSVEPAAGSHPARLTMRRDKRKERPLGALF
jgi:hypothetical protein